MPRAGDQVPLAAAPTSPGRATAERREGLTLELILISALSLAFVFGVVRPFLLEAFFVSSESMTPTLRAGDHVLANKLVYRVGDPGRGDLVVFREAGGEASIKRVVGLPGDTVAVRDGVLHLNGEPVAEPYVNYRLNEGSFFGPERVPAGGVFVMGDNRANSVDSRALGPVRREDLLGKVLLRLWPVDAGSLRHVTDGFPRPHEWK